MQSLHYINPALSETCTAESLASCKHALIYDPGDPRTFKSVCMWEMSRIPSTDELVKRIMLLDLHG